uniref:AP complex subunit sigma n=1 Tax=Chromera velia CCMP2878 TaxID=1169474 RepID=A0A0K6S9I7_9ALVE|mmetsp:Transcript_9320/g.18189  ORF Transcript_9320/g.18189 Transcript_9320/m.18189 type:complete len:143 (-) Transcript_9320:72-500(-)|eukprot:Cvel_30315.t1-p1 / transcript=Cvel_30315.t1 / gene=Cvel_30315 / organism=Chromera_velia_CCMP2878 / gene_product=AP-2 complex subunit sigma, putative / transcript_product=AP-2 complex subunit sigma, putative / location=Cvel_scaffold4302:6206-8658(-) / protein_length=142 / sequence_SO=supercontig / SO=protein_coding / is_pseudo=false
MIRFILLQNRQGKTRLSKWYVPFRAAEKAKIEAEIHRAVVSRERKWANFLEYRNYKLVYKWYASLCFICCVDVTENELAVLELIHLFVELLDIYFGNVCELDLIFDFDRVYHILDSIVLGGEVVNTSQSVLLDELKQSDKLD